MMTTQRIQVDAADQATSAYVIGGDLPCFRRGKAGFDAGRSNGTHRSARPEPVTAA